MDKVNRFIQNLQKDIKIKFKNESLLMNLIGLLFFFNKDFMTHFTTTIGHTIYFPSREYIEKNKERSISILAHEFVHIYDSDKYSSFIFSFLYLFPQILSIFSIFSFVSLWFLLFLIFLLPIPAYFRSYFEFRGYSMTLFVNNLYMKRKKTKDYIILEELTKQANKINQTKFKGPDYYWMWPFGYTIKFSKAVKDVISDDILKDKAFYMVKEALDQIY